MMMICDSFTQQVIITLMNHVDRVKHRLLASFLLQSSLTDLAKLVKVDRPNDEGAQVAEIGVSSSVFGATEVWGL